MLILLFGGIKVKQAMLVALRPLSLMIAETSRLRLIIFTAVLVVTLYGLLFYKHFHPSLSLIVGGVFFHNYSYYESLRAAQRNFPNLPLHNRNLSQCSQTESRHLAYNTKIENDLYNKGERLKTISVTIFTSTDVDMIGWIWDTILQSGSTKEAYSSIHGCKSDGILDTFDITRTLFNVHGIFHFTLEKLVFPRLKNEKYEAYYKSQEFHTLRTRLKNRPNILYIGQNLLQHMVPLILNTESNIGAILLGDENCKNNFPLLFKTRLKFLYTTYGACQGFPDPNPDDKNKFVYNSSWKIWPLGPKTSAGFPGKVRHTIKNSSVSNIKTAIMTRICGF